MLHHRDGIGIGRKGGPIGADSPGFVDSLPYLLLVLSLTLRRKLTERDPEKVA